MFTSAPKKIQDELIEDIKNKKPKFIIYNSKKDNFYNSDIMLKTVNKSKNFKQIYIVNPRCCIIAIKRM